ncbi:YjcZ family sporulation protein [Pseudalkalibacillus sp. SCS-8]|uniref:YjcZ family sporulation protein n=1 Tax=Pseudalkalibacillus nanhaiensis TaxID=3115291 RepID=UPI0039C94606
MKKYMPKKKEMMDYGYDHCYPMHHGYHDGYGGWDGYGFVIIVVLFILLIIVGCTCAGGKGKD